MVVRTSLSTLAIGGLCLGLAVVGLAADCSRTSVGFVPLDDLGSGLYLGVEGGLYPGGSNARPAAHDLALDRVGRVELLDAVGRPDAASGRIVLLSIGMSNTTQEFVPFVMKATADPGKNPGVVVVDGAQGGMAAGDIIDPEHMYWSTVDTRLAMAGVTPLQVQSIWLKEARRSPVEPFPMDAAILTDNLRSIVQILADRFPSLRSVYLTSRIYAGYATSTLNPEPYAYQSGFAVKDLIAEQLAGSAELNFDPARGAVRSPWLAWGPYLWADGLVPRSDGLTWACSDFAADGTHPAVPARERVSDALLNFFETDATTAWFRDCDVADPALFAAPGEARELLLVRETGGGGRVALAWRSLDAAAGAATVYDVASGLVSELRSGGASIASCASRDLDDSPWLDDGSSGVPSGDARWYRVRGRNGCGTGTWGSDELDAASVCP